jgi:hypothetical protein
MGKFIDFESIKNTNWAKPSIETKPLWLLAAAGVLAALISLFMNWLDVSFTARNITTTGTVGAFSTYQGIIVMISVILAIYGLLYRQYGILTIAGLLIFAMGTAYFISAGTESAEVTLNGTTMTLKDAMISFKDLVRALGCRPGEYMSVIDGYGSLIAIGAGAVTALFGFLLYRKNK